MASRLEFCVGLMLGFGLGGLFGFAITKIRAAQAKMGAPNRPQVVTIPTEKTPAQVYQEANRARLGCCAGVVLLVGACAAVAVLVYFLTRPPTAVPSTPTPLLGLALF